MSLTQGACSRLWLSAQKDRPQPWEGRAVCVGCPVGAAFNGTAIQPIQVAIEAVRDLCPRCANTGRRLIGKDLCISCYNRSLEVTKGRDRKGNRPALCDVLRVREIMVSQGGRVVAVRQRAVSHAEMMVRIVKGATGPVAFSPVLPPWIGPQAVMRFGALSGRPRRVSGRRRAVVITAQQSAFAF